MGAFLAFRKSVLCATDNYFNLVGDVMSYKLIESKRARHIVNKGQHVCAEWILKLGVFVEII